MFADHNPTQLTYTGYVGFESGFRYKAVGFGFGFKEIKMDSDSGGFGFKIPEFAHITDTDALEPLLLWLSELIASESVACDMF